MWNRIAQVLAVVPPLVVGALVYQWLLMWKPPTTAEDQRLMGNAGRILNGKVTRLGVVAEIESLMATRRPQVIILGNSYANTNVVPAVVAEGLGIPENKVLTLSVPNSVTSHWYAILENRVYDDGYQVPLVMVVSGLQSLLGVEPYSESSYEDLMIQLDADEPVLGQVIDLEHPELRLLMRNRVLVRDLAMNTIRDTSVDMFFAGGSQVTTEAMTRLFSDENIDMSRHNAAQPKVNGTEGDDVSMVGMPSADESLVEELSQLARQNNSTLVYVRPPIRAYAPDERQDTVTTAAEAEVPAIFARYDHAFVDLTDLQLPRRAFKNVRHLSPEGAELFTQAVVDEVKPVWNKSRPPRRR